ncbi:MAG TPA: methionyl-tRNA formyltransferase [Bdellovibrionales bacterium]|nr:methionyl-tRNA formyltransferase [Bdellovibrionales bacterium]
MSKVRILFLGTPDFAAESLRRLIEDDHFEIVGVVSQPDRPAGRKMQLKASPVKELALAHGLRVMTPETVNTDEFRAEIKALGAEGAAVVAFGQILGQKFLDLFPKKAVNVHGSILPRWRGAAPIQRAVMAGDAETGVTLQIIVRKLDAGPVLGERRMALPEDMNAMELHDRLKVLGADLLHVEFMDYLRGNLHAVEQDESQVTHAAKIEKSETQIDWTKSASEVHNRVRGLQMGPYAWANLFSQNLKIHKTRVSSKSMSGSPGDHSVIDENGTTFIRVVCGSGAVDILELQPESRARMAVADFVRGLRAGEKK